MKTLLLAGFVSLASLQLPAGENPFVGRWALTLPDGCAGWLSVEKHDGHLSASILWGSGSVGAQANEERM
jgi:hypothetical protein